MLRAMGLLGISGCNSEDRRKQISSVYPCNRWDFPLVEGFKALKIFYSGVEKRKSDMATFSARHAPC